MKKLFIEPAMDIKSFEAENIVTDSAITGNSVDVTEAQKAKNVLTVDAQSQLHFTFWSVGNSKHKYTDGGNLHAVFLFGGEDKNHTVFNKPQTDENLTSAIA